MSRNRSLLAKSSDTGADVIVAHGPVPFSQVVADAVLQLVAAHVGSPSELADGVQLAAALVGSPSELLVGEAALHVIDPRRVGARRKPKQVDEELRKKNHWEIWN